MDEAQSLAQRYRNAPLGPYSGHQRAIRPPADPELTQVGPGTPGGEYLRRFWQPVAMVAQVGEVPLRVRRLGEDLVLFRTGDGAYGLLHLHCSHRNTSLEFGVVERDGLRCCYHGWKYAVDGSVLETPGEPAGSRRKDTVCHGAYPVREHHGLLFAYLGPYEQMPQFPLWDTTQLPGVELLPYYIDYPCNYLQVAENTMDPWHTVFLHARVTDIHFGSTWGLTPVIEFFERAHCVYSTLTYRVDDMIWVRSQETTFPTFSQVGAFWEEGRDEKYFRRASITKWTVPHDDTHCMIIGLRSFGPAIDPDGHGKREQVGAGSVDFPGQTGVEPYEFRQRHPNDYEAQVSIGPIAQHACENLGTTDKGVALLRRGLRRGIRMLQAGETLPRPPHTDGEWPTLAQDTVLPIPRRADAAADEQLLRDVTAAVMQVVLDGERFAGEERRRFTEAGLRAINHDPRFRQG